MERSGVRRLSETTRVVRAVRRHPDYRLVVCTDGAIASKPVAVTVAWGGNREFNGFNGNNDGYLAEGRVRATDLSTVYGRVEGADKEIFGLGLHPRGFSHRHTYFRVYAFTAGYIRDLRLVRWGRLGIRRRRDNLHDAAGPAAVLRWLAFVPCVRSLETGRENEACALAGRRRLFSFPCLHFGCNFHECPLSRSPNCSARPSATPAAPREDACAKSRSPRRIIRRASRI